MFFNIIREVLDRRFILAIGESNCFPNAPPSFAILERPVAIFSNATLDSRPPAAIKSLTSPSVMPISRAIAFSAIGMASPN